MPEMAVAAAAEKHRETTREGRRICRVLEYSHVSESKIQ
jgi:hypothetical protein